MAGNWYDQRLKGALADLEPAKAQSGALPPDASSGYDIPADVSGWIAANTPKPPPPPPPPNTLQKVAGALYSTFADKPDPTKPRSTGQRAYDWMYNHFTQGGAGEPTIPMARRISDIPKNLGIVFEPWEQNPTWATTPEEEAFIQKAPGWYQPILRAGGATIKSGLNAMGSLMEVPAAVGTAVGELGGLNPETGEVGRLRRDLEIAAQVLPLAEVNPEAAAGRAIRAGNAKIISDANKAGVQHTANIDAHAARVLDELENKPLALPPSKTVYGDNFTMRPAEAPPAVTTPKPVPRPKPVATEVATPAPITPAPDVQPPAPVKWRPLFDEGDNQIGWHDRQSGNVSHTERPPTESAQAGATPSPVLPREAAVQPTTSLPVEPAPTTPIVSRGTSNRAQPKVAVQEAPSAPQAAVTPGVIPQAPAAETPPGIKQGRVRGVQVNRPAEDAAGILAARGGIRNNEGHDLVSGRGLQQLVPGRGPLIRPNGMSIDRAGELLWDRGFFGNPDHTPRPIENEILQFLEKTKGPNGRPVKIYPPERVVEINQAAEAARTEETNAAAHQEVRDAAKGLGIPLKEDDIPAVVERMGGKNLDAESAIVEYTERQAMQHEDALAKETGDAESYRPVPFEGNAEPSGTAGKGIERPAGQLADAGKRGQVSPDVAQPDSGALSARQLAAERDARRAAAKPEVTAEPVDLGRGVIADQTVIPGAEQAAASDIKSAADRRVIEESQQLPRANSGKVQKPNDQGLFAPPPEKALFQRGEGEAPQPGERVNLGSGVIAKLPENPTPREAAVIDQVSKIARRIVPDAKVRAARELEYMPDGASQTTGDKLYGATYRNGVHRLIAWSLESPDAAGTLRHEAVHWLKKNEFITPEEWSALEAAAEKKGWLDKHDIPNRYSDLERSAQIEEAIAEEYRAWANGMSNATPPVRRIFNKVKNLLGQVAGYARKAFGKDATAEDVFRSIESGEVGRRAKIDEFSPDMSLYAQRPAMRDPSNTDGPFSKLATDPPRSVREEWNDRARSLVERLKGVVSRDAIDETLTRFVDDFQDKNIRFRKMKVAFEREFGRDLPEEADTYLHADLAPNIKDAKTKEFHDDMLNPLLAAMHKSGITPDELDTYLYARHAPERNAQIQKINPKFGGAKGTILEDLIKSEGGSGMTDAEAADIMRGFERAGKTEALEALAKRHDAMHDLALKERVESGLISKADAARWKATYKHYTPLRGFQELEAREAVDLPQPHTGRMFSVRGAESKRALGRETRADSPLANTIAIVEEVIVRGENNRVANSLYNFAKEAPAPDFWQINKVETRPVFVEKTQSVEYRPTKQLSELDKKYTVSLKRDGDEYHVTFNRNNPYAKRLAEAIAPLGPEQFGKVLDVLRTINRWWSNVYTAKNPEFVLVNGIRDLQEGTINLQKYDIKGITAKAIANYPQALAAATKGEFGVKSNSEWGKLWREFVEDGGKVGFNQTRTVERVKHDMQRDFAMAKPGLHPIEMPVITTKKVAKKVGDTIDHINGGVENTLRLAVYKAMRDSGVSRKKSAQAAYEITIPFNRRGKYGPALNAAYLFYNASMQGGAVMVSALKSKRVRQIAVGLIGLGFTQELINAKISAADDDGELYYDKVDDYKKTHNFIVWSPFGKRKDAGLTISTPYGYGVFLQTGRAAAELLRGKDFHKVAANLGSAFADAFNPIGDSGHGLLGVVLPTVFRPFVDTATNKDYSGKSIVPEQNDFGPKKPNSQMYWQSVSPTAKGIAQGLNRATGGDEVKPGAIDVSPELLDFWFGQVTGSAGKFYERLADLGPKMLRPDYELTPNDIPFARRFVTGKSSWYDKQMFYERSKQIQQELEYVKDYARRGDIAKARGEISDYHNLLSLSGIANQTKQSLSAIRQARNSLIFQHDLGRVSDEVYKLRIRRLKEAESAAITVFNKAYVNTVKPAYVPPPKPPEAVPVAPKKDKRAELTGVFKARDFASLTGEWSPNDAVKAAKSANMPATARILNDAGDDSGLINRAA